MLTNKLMPTIGEESKLISIINKLGYGSNLRFCFDAGDSSSYTSGQLWNDVSGNSDNFMLGQTTSSGTDDPTFNGTAGSRNETNYFSSDGLDMFLQQTAKTYSNNLNANGSQYTIVFIGNLSTTYSTLNVLFSNANNSATNSIYLQMAGTNANNVYYSVNRGTGTYTDFNSGISKTQIGGAPAFIAVSLNIGSTSYWQINNFSSSFTATCAGTAGSNTQALSFMARTTLDNPMPNGTRMYGAMFWSRQLSQLELFNLYTQFKTNRFNSMKTI